MSSPWCGRLADHETDAQVQPGNFEASGIDIVLTQALYSIVGAISLQNGGEVANRIARERILAPLGLRG